MGKWNANWMKGMNDLIRLKVPVQAQFKDAQTFGTNLGKAEEINNRLIDLKSKLEPLLKEKAEKQEELKKLFTAIQSKLPDYDKALESLEKVMEKNEKQARLAPDVKAAEDGQNAVASMKFAIGVLEGLFKDTIALKF